MSFKTTGFNNLHINKCALVVFLCEWIDFFQSFFINGDKSVDKKSNWHYMLMSRIDEKLSFKLAKKQISLHPHPQHTHIYMHARFI